MLNNIRVNQTTKEMISFLKSYRKDEIDLMELVQKLEREMAIDPARIIGDEIKLFAYCMKKIADILGNDYESYLKIAVLHHHNWVFYRKDQGVQYLAGLVCDTDHSGFSRLAGW